MNATAREGVFVVATNARKNAGPRKPIDCIVLRTVVMEKPLDRIASAIKPPRFADTNMANQGRMDRKEEAARSKPSCWLK